MTDRTPFDPAGWNHPVGHPQLDEVIAIVDAWECSLATIPYAAAIAGESWRLTVLLVLPAAPVGMPMAPMTPAVPYDDLELDRFVAAAAMLSPRVAWQFRAAPAGAAVDGEAAALAVAVRHRDGPLPRFWRWLRTGTTEIDGVREGGLPTLFVPCGAACRRRPGRRVRASAGPVGLSAPPSAARRRGGWFRR